MKKYILVLLLLISVSCSKPEAKGLSGNPKGIKELKADRNISKQRAGYYIVPLILESGRSPRVILNINGKAAKFLVDTGASKSFINFETYKQYGFNINIKEPEGFVFGAKGIDMPYFSTYNCKLTNRAGDIIDIDFAALDLHSSATQMGIVGIIGIDFMKYNNVILDLKNKIMIYGR